MSPSIPYTQWVTHRAGNHVWEVSSQVLNVEEIVGSEVKQPEMVKRVVACWRMGDIEREVHN